MPLCLLFPAVRTTGRGFSAYMDFILMNCLIFSRKYVFICNFWAQSARMLVDWKQSQLVSLEITFRANCIGISIPGLKSVSSSWTVCSAPRIQTWNKKLGVLPYPGAHCTRQGEPHLYCTVTLQPFFFFPQVMGKVEVVDWGWEYTFFSNIVNVLSRTRGKGDNPLNNLSKISDTLKKKILWDLFQFLHY